ncbi:MAG TPA: ATP-binding cassette domain-containing protein [Planctomycetaceae bacterium]|nr:ATP-binding cassette domain-containing protein [Planctomycetaceae bacterium]HIQ22630.1 ATP-binding cassette domain-containing protein [Planctomycetota bacterium]
MDVSGGHGESKEEALLRADGLWVRFGRQVVLRDISFAVARGQTLAVIGESGCGKTVLLKTLVGLINPWRGAVYFDGKNLSSLDEKQLALQRMRFGFVFQSAALFDSLTVGQNVAFPLEQHTRKSDEEIQRIVVSRLAEVGLSEDVILKRPAELSGGMRKRVGLARALALEPEVVLYDEPTTGLDPIMSDVIAELILRARQRHPVTSIVVTHDLRAARKVADRVIMLYPLTRLGADEPQIVYAGPPEAMESAADPRVSQFARGEARDRLVETGLSGGV